MPPPLRVDSILSPVYYILFTNPYCSIPLWIAITLTCLPLARSIFILIASVAAVGPPILHIWRRLNARPVKRWEDEVVLITGGAHGLGRMVAEFIARQHRPKKVVVLDIRPSSFQDDSIVAYQCDVTNRQQLRQVAARVREECGDPTILINNAGVVSPAATVVQASEADIRKVIEVNLLSQFWVVKEFLPHMVAMNRGQIITIASVLANTSAALAAPYCASKAGVAGFHEALRQELLKTNIRLTCLFPGLIDTGMFTGMTHQNPAITPILSVPEVARVVVKAVEKGENANLYLPFYAQASPLMRMLPVEVADWFREKIGANKDMLTFKYSASAQYQ
ncbi:hypothetical protein DFS34DRAFT_130597 [Phlyctochytrium arcticum]|nr:hypothetical protein DFS34DRAFT_130597 [Phlyctochytrium arcticum]